MTDLTKGLAGGRIPAQKTTSKYIDPLSDFGFKRLFGSEPQKDVLIDFLNSLFEGEKEIVDRRAQRSLPDCYSRIYL